MGEQGQRRLAEAKALVIGAGGLGSPVIAYLAAAGVGTLGIVDTDVVDTSNLQRQIIHRTDDVDLPKTTSARRFAEDLDPSVTVHEIREYFDETSALRIARGYDLIIDGADNFSTRYAAADAAAALGIPHVWGAILRYAGHVCTFHEPEGPGYRDLFPDTPDEADQPNCATAGVLGALCGVVGTTMAVDAIKILTGVGSSPVGRFRTYDALEGTWRSLRIRRDPERMAADTSHQVNAEGAVGVVLSDVTAEELARELAGESPPRIIDVREESELAGGVIPGALHIPLARFLEDPAQAGVRRVVLYCASGIRSRKALSALAAQPGAENVRHLRGGYASWA
jgi:adenylyltransferase/sulfurtransferase